MSIQPAVDLNSLGTGQGTAEIIADIQRRLATLFAQRTIIGPGSVTGPMIQPGSITTGSIAAGSITTELLAAGAITAGNISAGAIQTEHLAAGSIVSDKIAAAAITAGKIAAGAIQSGNIEAGAIQTLHLAAESVTAEKLAAGAITSEKISVVSLSSLSSDMGAITAGTIQGATIQSGSTGSRWVADSAGIRGYALDGITKTFEINTGTGIASFTGIAHLDPGSIIPGSALPDLAGGNVVRNSGFEDEQSPLQNWNGVGPGGQPFGGGTVAHNTNLANVHQGTRSLIFVPSTNLGLANWFGQTGIRIIPGAIWTLSFWVKGVSSNPRSFTAMYSSVKSDGVTNNTNLFAYMGRPIPGAWTRLTATMTFPQDISTGGFYIHANPNDGDSGTIYIDSVQFEEGGTTTSYSARPDEVLFARIGAVQIAAGAIAANHIQAGAITAEKISIKYRSANDLPNARLTYWGVIGDPEVFFADSPGHWVHYDNGGSGTKTWSKVSNGGPDGGHSWRVVGSSVSIIAGFQTLRVIRHKANTSYTYSFMWKGNAYPYIGSNTPVQSLRWVEVPVPSPTTWQRYSLVVTWGAEGPRAADGSVASSGTALVPGTALYPRTTLLPSSTSGGAPTPAAPSSTAYPSSTLYPGSTTFESTWNGGYDWFYIRAASNSTGSLVANFDVQIANIQREEGDYPTPFSPRADEILPGSVGTTEITPNSITTEKILAGTILASDIAAATITGTNIAALTITSANIAAGAITAGKIAAGTITAAEIAAATITATHLAVGSITAEKINFIVPSRNLLYDSSFISPDVFSSNRWFPSGGTVARDPTGGPVSNGPNGYSVSNATSDSAGMFQMVFNIVPSTLHVGACYARSPAGRRIRILVTWFSASNAVLGSKAVFLGTASSTWTRFTPGLNTFLAPASAASAAVYFLFDDGNGNPPPNGEINRLAYLQFHNSDVVPAWSQYIDPAVIDGATITAPVIRTSAVNPKVQLDATGFFITDNTGFVVARFQHGAGGLEIAENIDTTTVGPSKLIRWYTTNNNSIAYIHGARFTSSGFRSLYSRAYTDGSNQVYWLLQQAGQDANNAIAMGILAGSSSTQTRVLLWGDGTSNFSQVGSDRRFKSNIVSLKKNELRRGSTDKHTEILRKLNPVQFEWKDGRKKLGKRIGLIAQEVKEILPEVVVPDARLEDNGSKEPKKVEYQGIDSLAMISYLVSIVQKLDERIEALESA